MVVGAFVHKYKAQLCVGILLTTVFVGALTGKTTHKPLINTVTPTPVPTLISPVAGTSATPTVTLAQGYSVYPNVNFTPGDVFPNATVGQICTSGYSASVRNVTVVEKQHVYQEYGLSYPQPVGAYEVDHFIPLELGGSNDIKNLWPEAATPVPGFHQKDEVENYLHSQVCAGKLSLVAAQQQIRTDWVSVYKTLHTTTTH